jgi:hypothetical protein
MLVAATRLGGMRCAGVAVLDDERLEWEPQGEEGLVRPKFVRTGAFPSQEYRQRRGRTTLFEVFGRKCTVLRYIYGLP